ncbi:hypothetical protein [Haliea sp.]|jgi:hypothetical protein|uniref:hypothetical protein n=1 Tax=Haliea TaxID=475794 RepID=UPI000C474EB7|nr:hypothetical protein [Haliea sp.]HCD55942.1 hypothetical protein [Halieaceae bacterium]MAD62385.1 hypothetical protein [Haliea sp.]MAY91374.1 hypothetical protein [Haliea sp.]MBK41092.1 hypothetical protein [Haliea sp.]MBP71112.1 hypothetical protein [Haliea sp.]|tara:strand:- start:4198 stop:5103 length:906 start_codon:yes stop_codon:yes gene_type:complete
MDAFSCFQEWRINSSAKNSWGLAWFLANEICKRFYASHGIVPWVIEHDGIGYYGITLNQLECKVTKGRSGELGRFTIGGDVENWTTGALGDHSLETIEMCENGFGASTLITDTIHHLGLNPFPEQSHQYCRHKRWGDSYTLCFELATIIALRYEKQVQIANHPFHTSKEIELRDPQSGMKEHPGAFFFSGPKGTLIVTGDGRVLDDRPVNIWERYMLGESIEHIVKYVAESVGAKPRPTLSQIKNVVSYLPRLYPTRPIKYGTMSATRTGTCDTIGFPNYEYSPLVEKFFKDTLNKSGILR